MKSSLFYTRGLAINDGRPVLRPIWYWLADNIGNIVCGLGIVAILAYVIALPEFHW